MALSKDIIKQFTKIVNDSNKKEAQEKTVNATYKKIDNVEYIQIDGSDILTPVTSTVQADDGDRVKVLIKNHSAIITGNITNPSASSTSVNNIKDKVDENGNTIKQINNTIEQQNNSIIQIDNSIKQVENKILQYDNDINQQNNKIEQFDNTIKQQNDKITSMNNTIIQQGNDINSINNTIDQQNNSIKEHNNSILSMNNQITSMNNKIELQGNDIKQQGTKIEAFNSDIKVLNSAFKIDNGVLTGLSDIIVNNLKTNNLDAVYANLDFSNINFAAIKKVFSESGIIKDLVVNDGTITGELVGVTIKGDLIEANTLKADKLVILGEDGLYYKLNVNALGETTASSDPKYQNGLDGSVIIAKSITAEKVNVGDLVAFGATIGGYNITSKSLYSGVKDSVSNTTKGVYLGMDGQFAVGDANNFLKFFKDTDGTYKLEIKAESIKFGSGGSSIEDELNNTNDNIKDLVKNAEVQYYLSTSNTTLSGGSWVNNAPAWADGKYMWSRTKITKQDGTIEYEPSENGTCISGAQGPKGDKGEDAEIPVIEKEISGNKLYIPDSSYNPFIKFKINNGVTKQDTRSGKNIFNINEDFSINGCTCSKTNNSIIAIKTTNTGTSRVVCKFECEKNTDYILSLDITILKDTTSGDSNNCIGIRTGSGSGSWLNGMKSITKNINQKQNIKYEFNSSNYSVLYLWLYLQTNGNGDSGEVENKYENIMIRKASVEDDSYEEYGQMPSTKFPSKIRNVGDNINFVGGAWTKGYYSVDGELLNSGKPNRYRCFKANLKKGTYKYSYNARLALIRYVNLTTNSNLKLLSGKCFSLDQDSEISFAFRKEDNTDWDLGENLEDIQFKIEESNYATAYSNKNCGSLGLIIANENLALGGYSTDKKDIIFWNSTSSDNNFIPLEDGWARFIGNNKNGSSTAYINAFIAFDKFRNIIKKGADYKLIVEWRNVNITGSTGADYFCVSTGGGSEPFVNKNISYKYLLEHSSYSVILNHYYASTPSYQRLLRSFLSISAGNSSSLEIRISIVEENSTSTDVKVGCQEYVFPFKEGQRLYDGSYLANDGIHHKRKQVKINIDDFASGMPYSGTFYLSNRKYIWDYTSVNAICNYFKNAESEQVTENFSASQFINDNEFNFRMGDTKDRIYFKNSAFTTLEQWRDFFNNNDVIVEYECKEYIEPYTPEQQEVHDNIMNNSRTYNGVTNVFCTNDIVPELYAKYYTLYKGSVGNGISKTEVSYQASISGIIVPTGTWYNDIPVIPEGQYLWTRTITKYYDGSDSTGYSVSRIGNTGNGISSITEHYQVSTSNTKTPTSWSTTVPKMTATNKYLWNYETINYTDGTTEDTTKRVIGVYGDQGLQGSDGEPGVDLSQGKMLYKDPMFTTGLNNVQVYNLNNNGTVTITRVKRSSDNPTKSDYELLIQNTGDANPEIGGFAFRNMSRANAIFVYRIIAKIPTGRTISERYNDIGVGATIKWLTSQEGTGKFQEYLFKLTCGPEPNNTSFGSAGFFKINGADGTTDNPVEWRLAYATCFDMTDASDSQSALSIGTEAKDKIDNLDVGGRNLLLDSSNPTSDFYTNKEISSLSGETFKNCNVVKSNNAWGGIRFDFKSKIEERGFVENNDEFTYSIYAKLSENETKTDIRATMTAEGVKSGVSGTASRLVSVQNTLDDPYITKEWKRFYYTFKVPKEYRPEGNGYVGLTRIEQNAASSTDCYVMWACPKLEKGNKPTDWTPAPEDVDDSISNVQASADEAQQSANNAQQTADDAKFEIENLKEIIYNLITDDSGGSLMTQTPDGWTFNMSTITSNIDALKESLVELAQSNTDTNNLIENLSDLLDSISAKTAYITITTTDDGDPCIELGKTDNLFKVRITNTAIDFMEGSSIVAYVNNNIFYTNKMIVKSELQIGEGPGFVWKTRPNGNMGLVPIS